MRIRWMIAAYIAWLGFGSIANAGELINLKVLYAGDLKNKRADDFQAFLKSHFVKVGLADYLTLKQATTQDYDVVILDWPGLPPKDGGKFKIPEFDSSYDRPTILIGGGSLGVGRHQGLKLDDLCICLGDAAHDIRASHEIFHTPYETHLEFEDRPTPAGYRSWPEGDSLGKTIKVWKVQKRGWAIDDPINVAIPPGMVSDPYGFTDSPDAEFIASGINMKSPVAVAIGRQGNFLLWGFYAQPSDLTTEARKCFINAVCYIKKFDGQAPLVRKTRGRLARQWAVVFAFAYKEAANPDLFSQSQPDSVRANPEMLAALYRYRVAGFRKQIPEDLQRRLGDDPASYVAYFKENLEFLRPAEMPAVFFVVDEDVRTLRISNRKLELLDKCVGMLETGDQSDLALRILKRYTTEDFTAAKDWRAWLETSRARLYFTDLGGFKFLIAPESMHGSTEIATGRPEPNSEHPVVYHAEFSRKRVAAGESLELVVRLNMAPTWHIYAAEGVRGPGVPTALKLTLPKGIEPERGWTYPAPSRGSDGQMIYEGAVEFRHKLRVDREAARGSLGLSCELSYQACDQSSCQLPAKENLHIKLEITERSR